MNALDKRGVFQRLPWLNAPLQICLVGFWYDHLCPLLIVTLWYIYKSFTAAWCLLRPCAVQYSPRQGIYYAHNCMLNFCIPITLQFNVYVSSWAWTERLTKESKRQQSLFQQRPLALPLLPSWNSIFISQGYGSLSSHLLFMNMIIIL